MMKRIPFNRPHVTGTEFEFIREAIANNHLSGDGPFTSRCQAWLDQRVDCRKALLTHSCTAALDMDALLAGVGPGDEVIMPSYPFVSTANAFALRGAVPVFVDVRPDTLNLDERLIEAADHGAHQSSGEGGARDEVGRVVHAIRSAVSSLEYQRLDVSPRG